MEFVWGSELSHNVRLKMTLRRVQNVFMQKKKTAFLINQLDVTLSAYQVFQKFLSNYKSLPEL